MKWIKLKRLITEEEYSDLKILSERSPITDEDIYYINNLLFDVIEDFISFECFEPYNPTCLRFQWLWPDKSEGVGIITINELKEGFDLDWAWRRKMSSMVLEIERRRKLRRD